MAGSEKHSISGSSADAAETLEHRVAMDKLGEIVADYESDSEPFTAEEVEAARALLRHDHRLLPG